MKMNEEQTAAAKKELRGFHFPVYAAQAKRVSTVRENPAPPIVREGAPTIVLPEPAPLEATATEAPSLEAAPDAPPPSPLPKFGPVEIGTAQTEMIYIEAERWIDARSFACRKLGASEVVISTALPVDNGHRPFPRWQVRWAGSAAGANTLRMQARLLTHAGAFSSEDHGWQDTRML